MFMEICSMLSLSWSRGDLCPAKPCSGKKEQTEQPSEMGERTFKVKAMSTVLGFALFIFSVILWASRGGGVVSPHGCGGKEQFGKRQLSPNINWSQGPNSGHQTPH